MPQTLVRLGPWTLVVLGALSAFAPLSSDLYLPAMPLIGREWAASASLIQASLGACILGLGLGQALLGPLSDALGRRRLLLIGLALFALTSLWCAVAADALSLVVARLFQGFAGSTGVVLSMAIVRDATAGPAMARVLSRLLLVSGVAPIAAPLLGSALLSFTSWRWMFVVLAAVAVVLLAASWFLLPESLPEEVRRRFSPSSFISGLAEEARRPGFLAFALTGGLAIAAGATYISAAPFVLQGHYGVPTAWFGVIFGINAAGLVAVGQIGARWVDRVGARWLLGAGLAVLTVSGVFLVTVIAFGLGLVWVWSGLFGVTASLGLILPNSGALAMETAVSAGSAAALVGVIQFGIAALASPLAGIFGAGAGLSMAVLILVFGFAAVGTYFWSPRRRHSHP